MVRFLFFLIMIPATAFSGTVSVEPQTEDFLLINGRHFYLDNVVVTPRQERGEFHLLEIKVSGVLKWNEKTLIGAYRCEGGSQQEDLRITTLFNVWRFDKKLCPGSNMQFCLVDESGRQACSPWLNRSFKPAKAKTTRNLKAFEWDVKTPFTWERSDGRSMTVVWNEQLFEKDPQDTLRETPQLFLSGLITGLKIENAAQNFVILGTGQAVYWPKAAKKGDLSFDPKRIGGQARFSKTMNDVRTRSGRLIDVTWGDVSVNYRRNPSDVLDDFHLYGIVMASHYSLLGTTTQRLGGGFGASINYPKPFLGWNYPGKIYSYVDALALPLDLSRDNRGIIFSTKANGIWLFDNNWFVTGDIEMRILNFSMEYENSVIKVQLGGGYAF